MEKKTYVKPEMSVLEIEVESLLAANSIGTGNNTVGVKDMTDDDTYQGHERKDGEETGSHTSLWD